MNLLLDTHVFLWWLRDDRRLGAGARRTLESTARAVHVSAVSVWEIAVKSSVGKLKWSDRGKTTLASCILDCGFSELPITARHAAGVRSLLFHHADPFDRLLIAQALEERLRIVTADEVFAAYGVDVLAAGD